MSFQQRTACCPGIGLRPASGWPYAALPPLRPAAAGLRPPRLRPHTAAGPQCRPLRLHNGGARRAKPGFVFPHPTTATTPWQARVAGDAVSNEACSPRAAYGNRRCDDRGSAATLPENRVDSLGFARLFSYGRGRGPASPVIPKTTEATAGAVGRVSHCRQTSGGRAAIRTVAGDWARPSSPQRRAG